MRHHNQICQPGLVRYNNVRRPPYDRGEANRGFIGVWPRLGHCQTMLGGQPLEQVARAFSSSRFTVVYNTARCARHNRAIMTAAENVAAAAAAICKGSRIFRIAISSTPIQTQARCKSQCRR
jgi:hypothetical protein